MTMTGTLDWDAMRQVVERLVALGWVVEMNDSREFLPSCVLASPDGSRVISERGDTLPHAVALAALKAVEAES